MMKYIKKNYNLYLLSINIFLWSCAIIGLIYDEYLPSILVTGIQVGIGAYRIMIHDGVDSDEY